MFSNNLIRGTLSHLVLKLLSDRGQMYGYEMISFLKENSDYQINIKEAALYPCLHKLESNGYLEIENRKVSGRIRKYYRLSEKGKKVAIRKIAEMQNFVNAIGKILNPEL